MSASEFKHYSNHTSGKDPDNCSACALENPVMIDGKMGINYAGWPLSYLQSGRRIPVKFYGFLRDELLRTDNKAYVDNLKIQLVNYGYAVDKLLETKE